MVKCVLHLGDCIVGGNGHTRARGRARERKHARVINTDAFDKSVKVQDFLSRFARQRGHTCPSGGS